MNFMAMDLPQMNLVQMLEKMKFLSIIFVALIGTERLQDLHSSKDTSIRKVSNTGTILFFLGTTESIADSRVRNSARTLADSSFH